MRATLAVALCLALSSTALAETPAVSATSSERGRGWLTGAGLGLLGAGVAALVTGLNFQLTAADADKTLKLYLPTPEAVPAADEAYAVKLLSDRRDNSAKLAVAMLAGGGVLVAGGIACLIADGFLASAPVKVAMVPTREGGVVVLSGRW